MTLHHHNKKGFHTVTRWEELCSKVKDIAAYNLRRGMLTKYYLLNPANGSKWVEGLDCVEIQPSEPSAEHTMDTVLFSKILSPHNIRGMTPLDR
jgi:hypothetical protein